MFKTEKAINSRLKRVNTEIVHRRGDQIIPIWKPNFLGRLLEKVSGVGVRLKPFGGYTPVLQTHNLIVNVGHAGANGKMSNQGAYGNFTTIAIGIGVTAATISDTALTTESTTSGAARAVAGTISQVTTNVTNDTTQLLLTVTFTTAFAISEEGIFDTTTAPPSGHLLAEQKFATINCSSGDSLTIKHQYTT